MYIHRVFSSSVYVVFTVGILLSQRTYFAPVLVPAGGVGWGRRWVGIGEVWLCSLALVGWVFWWGWGGGGCFWIACFAAIFACSLVNATYRCRMSSALSTASPSSSIFSSAGIWRGSLSVFCFSTGCLIPREAMCWERVWIYARRSAFAWLRVVFAGGCVSSVSGDGLVC
jgi:hypothetical protein